MTTKTPYQVLALLSQYNPSSSSNRSAILGFIEREFGISSSPIKIFANPEDAIADLSIQEFVNWVEDGFGAGEVAQYGNELVLLGNCTLNTAHVIAKQGPWHAVQVNERVSCDALHKSNPGSQTSMEKSLHAADLQYNPNEMCLEPKYIPLPGDKVLTHVLDQSRMEVGVVRAVNVQQGSVEYYCLYTYPNPKIHLLDSIEHSMHVFYQSHLSTRSFEILGKSTVNNKFEPMNPISTYRRLKTELERVGVIWKDRLIRIEPIEYKLSDDNGGTAYFYINDKFKIAEGIDKGTDVHLQRYFGGNYFHTRTEAEEFLNQIVNIREEELAKRTLKDIEIKKEKLRKIAK